MYFSIQGGVKLGLVNTFVEESRHPSPMVKRGGGIFREMEEKR